MAKVRTSPKAFLLTVGSELLKGSTLNTNARFLADKLTAAGFSVIGQQACADSIPEIQNHLRQALRRAEVTVVCGGLGPTPDDVTRDAVAAFFKSPLVLSAVQWRRIRSLYKKLRRNLPQAVRQEALYPRCARPLVNRTGLALGFAVERSARTVIVLPGVPKELEQMVIDPVVPLLKRRYVRMRRPEAVVCRTVGLSEPRVMEMLGTDFFSEPFEFGIYPHPGEVTVRIYASDESLSLRLKRRLQKRLGGWVYTMRDISLAQSVGALLKRRKEWLAVAESCTGGQLSAELTKMNGAGKFFRGGWIVYHNDFKNRLGVPKPLLARNGAVSRPVAKQLAASAAAKAGAEWGIGITGIAGPSGGSKKKPVGLVYIGLRGPKGFCQVERFDFWGTRDQIQRRSVIKALELLWRALHSRDCD